MLDKLSEDNLYNGITLAATESLLFSIHECGLPGQLCHLMASSDHLHFQ